MAKIKKDTTARVACVIREVFKDEAAAAAGVEAETTEVKSWKSKSITRIGRR